MPEDDRTTDDFRRFAELMDRIRSLSDSKKKYLDKDDRDGVKRFRRDLCTALKNRKGGFERYTKVSNQTFAAILNDAGFADSRAFVTVEHVENGRRRFIPNATVPTRQVLSVMNKLKRRFPLLREDEFFGALPEEAVKWIAISEQSLRQR